MMACAHCGGALYWIGQLGSVGWLRCRNCGADQSDPEPIEAPECLGHEPRPGIDPPGVTFYCDGSCR